MNTRIKYNTLYKTFLYMIVILSIISYEFHIYRSLYSIVVAGVLLLGILLVIIAAKNKKYSNFFKEALKRNPLVNILVFTLLISTYASSLSMGLLTLDSVIGIILVIISIYVFYLFLPILIIEHLEQLFNLMIIILTLTSIISIVIGINGSFLGYSLVDLRAASIFFDSNYSATLSAIAVILCLEKKGFFYKLLGVLNFLGVFYTGSRTALVGLILVLALFYFYKKKINLKRMFLLSVMIFIIYYLGIFLYSEGYFRLTQGMTGRDLLWNVSLDYIFQSPLWGYGYGQVASVFNQANIYSNSSSHNYLIDSALMYGIPAVVVIVLILIKGIFNGLKYKAPSTIMKVIFYILINMNSIVISLGGVGATSLIFTIFLGVSNSYRFIVTSQSTNVVKGE